MRIIPIPFLQLESSITHVEVLMLLFKNIFWLTEKHIANLSLHILSSNRKGRHTTIKTSSEYRQHLFANNQIIHEITISCTCSHITLYKLKVNSNVKMGTYWWFAYDVMKNVTMEIMINFLQNLIWSVGPYKVCLYQIWSNLDQSKQSYGPKKLENFYYAIWENRLVGILLPTNMAAAI